MTTETTRIPEAQREGAVARYRAAYPDAATMADADILAECVRGDLRCPHCGRWDCGLTCDGAAGEASETATYTVRRPGCAAWREGLASEREAWAEAQRADQVAPGHGVVRVCGGRTEWCDRYAAPVPAMTETTEMTTRCECEDAREAGERCEATVTAGTPMVTVYVVPAYLRETARAAHGGYDRRMATAYRVTAACARDLAGPAYDAETCDDGIGLGEWCEVAQTASV